MTEVELLRVFFNEEKLKGSSKGKLFVFGGDMFPRFFSIWGGGVRLDFKKKG